MESGDRAFPTFYRPSHETAKIDADNPVNYYKHAETSIERLDAGESTPAPLTPADLTQRRQAAAGFVQGCAKQHWTDPIAKPGRP